MAAIAIPSYRHYQVNAKFAQAMTVVMSYNESALTYLQKNGPMTSIAQIGLTPSPSNALSAPYPPASNSEYIAPYLPWITFSEYNPVIPGATCGHFVTSAYISNYYGNTNTFAYDPLPFSTVVMYTYFKNGVYDSLCYFSASAADGSPDPNVHSADCYNLSNTAEAAEFTDLVEVMYTCTS